MAEKINTKPFILHSDFKPSGDQPQAIEKLVRKFRGWFGASNPSRGNGLW